MLKKSRILIYVFFIFHAFLSSGEFRLLDCKEFPNFGMFAAANQVLGQLSIYETRDPLKIDGLVIDFGTNGLYYDPDHGPNWWSYYFEPIRLGKWKRTPFSSLNKKGYFEAIQKRKQLTAAQASAIVNKYIRVKKHILEKVENFVSCHFSDAFLIGVHYRGTDKSCEAPRISYDKVFTTILENAPIDKPWRIFVATDEQQFLDETRAVFPEKVIACDAHRSISKNGIHFSGQNPYALGEEALIDALLLSRCDMLIRTSSNLSLWSTYFNPTIPTILLNKRFKNKNVAQPE